MAVSIDGAGSVTGLDAVDVPVYADAAARDTAIASPTAGQIVFVTGTGSLVYNGTAWVALGAGAANFTNTATGTYTDGGGIDYKYLTLTGSTSVTFDRAGFADVLLLAGGGGCNSRDGANGCGGAGSMLVQTLYFDVATLTVTIGAGGAGNTGFGASNGVNSSIGALLTSAGGSRGYSWGGYFAGNVPPTSAGAGSNANGFIVGTTGTSRGCGCGGTVYGSNFFDGRANSFTGSSVTYGVSKSSGAGSANTGDGGGPSAGAGGSGILVVRVVV